MNEKVSDFMCRMYEMVIIGMSECVYFSCDLWPCV